VYKRPWVTSVQSIFHLCRVKSRKKRRTCRLRSPFIIFPCGSVQALMLGFRSSKCWVSGLRLLMSEIWVFRVVIFLPYKSRSHVGIFCMMGYCSFYSAFYGGKIGRFSSTWPKPIALLSPMTGDSEVEMIHFRSTRPKPVVILSSMTDAPQVSMIHFSSTRAKAVGKLSSITK
jgi:hypothetical protein